MISSHVSDITLSKTIDPSRFSRMVGGGSLKQRIAGIKKLVERLDAPEYKTVVLEWLAYVESGKPLWSEIDTEGVQS
jgi:hypothetical protein